MFLQVLMVEGVFVPGTPAALGRGNRQERQGSMGKTLQLLQNEQWWGGQE